MRYVIFSDNNAALLKIATIGFGTGNESTRFSKKKRDLYIVHYVTKGEGIYNGHSVKCGQGFLMYPGDTVEYYGNSENPWEFLWIISSDDTMVDIFKRYNADPESLIFNYRSVEIVKEISKKVISKANSTVDCLKLLEMFLHIVNSHIHQSNVSIQFGNANTYIDFCVDYIASNIHKKITVEELTLLLGVSRPYLYKIFKSFLGISIKDYITSQKMNYAKQLLHNSDSSITEIAIATGFGDVLSFSKSFKVHEGISPSAYKSGYKNKYS